MQVQRCCRSNLCNAPIPISDHPRNNPIATPTFTPSRPTPPASSLSPLAPSFSPPNLIPDIGNGGTPYYPLCNCDNCHGNTCRALMCGTRITYSDLPMPDMTLICVNDTRICNEESSDLDPRPGTVSVICCDYDNCNNPLPLPPLPVPQPVPTTPTARTDGTTGEDSSD